MAIVSKGSGGSIRFTGTGGGIHIASSGGGAGGGGGGGPTDPSLTSLMAWYRADDIGLSNGGSVTGWVDRQGPSDLTRALNGNAIYNASNSDFNNRPTVNFDAGQKQLDTYDNASFDFGPQLAGNTIIVVVKPTYSPIFGFERIIEVEGAYPNFGQGYSIYQGNFGGASIFSQGGSSSGRITKTVEPNKALILYLSYEYGTIATQNTLQIFGGVSIYQESQSYPGIGTSPEMSIAPAGRLIVGGASPGANIAEILYYNAVQGAQEKTDTIAYLASRYGISV